MPKGNRTGSQTEYIALRYRDRVRHIDMYVAAMESLTKPEWQLIHLRYTEGMTYNALAEKPLLLILL